MQTQNNVNKIEISTVKTFKPNPVTPTLDSAFESKQNFVAFLEEIEVLQKRTWAANWIRAYWTDQDIEEYGVNGYVGHDDYEILEHMGEWLDAKQRQQDTILH